MKPDRPANMSFKQSFLLTLLLAIIVTAAFFAGFGTRDRLSPASNLPVLSQAYQILQDHGLNLPGEKVLEYGMIHGMLQAYNDPFSSFSEPPQAELQSQTLHGSYGGIGVTFGKDADKFYVLYPFPDSPAARAGIREGDRLVQVDALEIQPDTTQDVLEAALRGPVGDKVKIKITRPPDYQPFEFSVNREQVSLPSVTWHLEPTEPRLGVIKVNVIAATTPDEIQKAVQDLQRRGAQFFALDLRDNYGGLLVEGVGVARLFLKEGTVIQEQYRGQEVQTMSVDKPGALADLPLVVLVNQNTASAAEIISGALQAHKRALLIGVPTYGKDTIQLVFELQDKSSLAITSAHWWIPGLDAPHPGKGLQPDILLDKAEGDPDPAIQAAIKELIH